NDIIQIQGGQRWQIIGNRLGNHQFGAAQIFLSPSHDCSPGHPTRPVDSCPAGTRDNPISDVLIASNLLTSFPGARQSFAFRMRVETHCSAGSLPKNVEIVNNTILSGTSSSILLSPLYAGVDASARPLIANNVLALGFQCDDRARSVSNLIEGGAACDP